MSTNKTPTNDISEIISLCFRVLSRQCTLMKFRWMCFLNSAFSLNFGVCAFLTVHSF